MIPWWAWCFICVFAYYIGHRRGVTKGTYNERNRAGWLCHQGLMKRWSGTLRWVYNAIDSGADKLMDEDEFFGPEKKKAPKDDDEEIDPVVQATDSD